MPPGSFLNSIRQLALAIWQSVCPRAFWRYVPSALVAKFSGSLAFVLSFAFAQPNCGLLFAILVNVAVRSLLAT